MSYGLPRPALSSTEGHLYTAPADAIEWLDERVADYLRHKEDYYLLIGIVEGQITCRSALPHNDAGFCDVCWAVEQAWRSVVSPAAVSVDELAADGWERV